MRPVTRADDVSASLTGLRRGDRVSVSWLRGQRSEHGTVNL
jgi:hypothetical protein